MRYKILFSFFFIGLNVYSQIDPTEARIEKLLRSMTLEEKIGQTCLKGTSSRSKGLSEELQEEVRKGKVGAILNLTDPELVEKIQKIAVEKSPHHIPLLFGRDVIHGYRTIFPIPLGMAATWDEKLVEKTSEVAANEAYSRSINWTFAPMVDICRDARWGRIAESPGEDPLLASRLAAAYIRGFQGDDPSKPGRILACAKHFAAYGAAEGGRDYNSVTMSESLLRNIYLPSFHASVKAGTATFMSSFNDLNGIPASGNKFLLKKILRDEWKFKGFVVSDWASVTEMITHGYCSDDKDAALKAASAGIDMEMTTQTYANHLKTLLEEQKITEAELDEMVRTILRIKFKAGIFENPYFKDKEKFELLHPDALDLATEAAAKSCVLLKNENNVLPLSHGKKIAIIGPLAIQKREQLGTWVFDGRQEDTRLPYLGLGLALGSSLVEQAQGLSYSREETEYGFSAAITVANRSDVIVFFGGEEAILSGEAHSRADIRLPGAQEKLIEELYKTGKPIVLVIMAGRPITIEAILPKVAAVVMAWHPGTMGGIAIADILVGKINPSGKLPVTWPKMVGQIPIYYNHSNTGRPADSASFVDIKKIPIGAWQSSLGNNSHYLDAGFTPRYPFGYGLSYTTYEYSDLKLERTSLTDRDSLIATVMISNTGKQKGTEIAQLYVQDITASIVRPVKELKDFKHIELQPGENKQVRFSIPVSILGFYDNEGIYKVEPGAFKLWVGPHSASGLESKFDVK